MIRRCIWSVLIVLSVTLLTVSVFADSKARADRADARRLNVDQFDIGSLGQLPTTFEEGVVSDQEMPAAVPQRSVRPLGSALSTQNDGIGVGEIVAYTWDDRQVFYPLGRHVAHYYDDVTGDVSVHFCYEMARDSAQRRQENLPLRRTGYNVYLASIPGGDWPRGPAYGCEIQGADSIGFGRGGNMVISPDGLAVFVAYSSFFSPENPTVGFVRENKLFYQMEAYNCTYELGTGNVTQVDSTLYKSYWIQPTLDGNLSSFPSIATQFDGGGNLITHLVLAEQQAWLPPANTPGYPTGFATGTADYRVFAYFRKIGDGMSGTWANGRILDTVERNFYDLVADPWGSRVCFAYSNPSYSGIARNNIWDKDCYFRESTDYGVTWNPAVDITNYRNDLAGEFHASLYYETKALYTSDHNLHILFQYKNASANPYFDGYAWANFDQNIAHWDRVSGDYVRVADGSYINDDALTDDPRGSACSYLQDPSGYIQFFNLSECNGKLYTIWNQVFEQANHGDHTTDPTLMNDCSRFVNADRYGSANAEIFMSVARLETSTLWDQARNITNTYTPSCCLPGDEDPACAGPCGSEFKPYVEPYALNETGLDLDWPLNSIVDMSPGHNYGDPYYLNLSYLDDLLPGAAWDTSAGGARGVNGFYDANPIKWLRIGCVDPVEAALIEVIPKEFEFPIWVKAGLSTNFTITVINHGNVMLNVEGIGKPASATWLTFSEHPTPAAPFQITAGLDNTNQFDITISAAGITQPTWLDANMWLVSNAADYDSLIIPLHILAADTVEPVLWDTVATHQSMYSPFVAPAGTCIGLAVGNTGELGWGGGTNGRANLDYDDAAGGTMPLARQECDTNTYRNRVYLVSATPFVIMATSTAGAGALLTQSFNDLNQADENSFDPTADKGSLAAAVSDYDDPPYTGAYDSVYTGRFVNRDTSIAMERIVYGPRSTHPSTDTINFMIVYTKVYSGDGQAHNHVTIGNAGDWDVPASNYNHNLAGISGDFVYLRGTDTVGHDGCASHVGRYATEAFGGGYTSAEFLANDCVNNTAFHALNAVEQILMVDSAENNGVPVTPAQPNPLAWWQTASVGGLHFDPAQDTGRDYCLLMTYKHDYNLAASDTLHYWTVMTTTPIDGTLEELTAQVNFAKRWYTVTVRGCSPSCCVGRVGDANMSNETQPDEVTLGDIMLMVDVKFISGDCTKLHCIPEADVNQDGGASPNCDDHVTLGDIMVLVDHLFISQSPLKACL